MKKFYFLFFTLMLLVHTNVLFSQTDIPPEDITGESTDVSSSNNDTTSLGTVVVTSSKRSTKVKDLPVEVQVISSEDIENAGQTSISDVVTGAVAGMSYKLPYQNEVAVNGMLGGDAMGDPVKDQVLVLIDGRKAGSGDLSNVPSDIVERIEILKGPASAVYGNQAMGGVINIITKKGAVKPSASFYTEAGSFDYKKLGVSLSGPINDWMTYFISASYYTKGDHDTVENGRAYNSDEKTTNIAGNFMFDISDSQNLKLGYFFTDLHYGSARFDDSTGEYYKENLYSWNYDKSLLGFDLDYNLDIIKDVMDLNVTGYYTIYDYFFDAKKRTDTNSEFSDTSSYWKEYTHITRGIDTNTSYNLPFNSSAMKNIIIAGYTFENYIRESAKWNYTDSYAISEKPGTVQTTHSPYIQDSMSLFNDMINIVAGVRYDHYTMKKKKPSNYDDMDADNKAMYEGGNKDFSHLSPRAGIAFSPYDFIKIRAHYGQGMRIPTSFELLGYEVSKNYAPNPDLEPEISTSYEGGVDMSFNIADFNIGYRVVKYTDKIDSEDYTVGDYDERYVNLGGESETQSIDGGVTLKLGNFLNKFKLPVYARFSSDFIYYTKYEDADGKKLEDINKYEIKTNLNLALFERLTINLSHQLLGEAEIGDDEKRDKVNYLDANAGIYITKNYQVYGGIYNITNVEEYVSEKYLPERNYKAGVKAIF
ncbi:MAG: TonB-dependent receptor [Spirochaetes bacterium]|nr:TonB-dependent receptor [Spirochaetota bacterium]